MNNEEYTISEDLLIHNWTKAELDQYHQNVYDMIFAPIDETLTPKQS